MRTTTAVTHPRFHERTFRSSSRLRSSPDVVSSFCHLVDILRVIPDSQILIETDRRASAPGTTEELVRVCGAISEAKGVSVEEAGMLANRNALRFLAEISPPREEGT